MGRSPPADPLHGHQEHVLFGNKKEETWGALSPEMGEPVPKGYILCDSIYDSERDRGQVSAARGQGWGGARREVFSYKGQNEGS